MYEKEKHFNMTSYFHVVFCTAAKKKPLKITLAKSFFIRCQLVWFVKRIKAIQGHDIYRVRVMIFKKM